MMRGRVLLLVLLLCIRESLASLPNNVKELAITGREADVMLPELSPSGAPQPFIPLLAPSPLSPFINNTAQLSGLCVLNFTAAQSVMGMTSIDCWSPFASVLANVICCPQLEATIAILIGQSSKETNALALNSTTAKHCLSDIQQALVEQGANNTLNQICSIRPSNLTEGSCPVKDVDQFESIVATSELLTACDKIDPVKECCEQTCQSAISEAANKIAQRAYDLSMVDDSRVKSAHSNRVDDCKNIVLRWLASKLEPKHAKEVLRGLTNCKLNKVCPLVFPDIRHVVRSCGNGMSNLTTCCGGMDSYVSHLQKQSLITNLQALDCASSLGRKFQRANITQNVFDSCHLSLKDFSLQVGNQEKGCLLPSLPSDVIFDPSGVTFQCDLNDNIPALWPTSNQLPASSSCNKTVRIPALPAAASAKTGVKDENPSVLILTASAVVLGSLL
uniref:SPARK domain-containing protein n=1 Tax=Kalanchoe fedtschenkoi TaxID=63787 RepID=A0A7N0ZW25_KALFE